MTGVFNKEEIRTPIYSEERSCEDTGRRWPSTSQGEQPQKKAITMV